MAFGYRSHACPGSFLAHLEAEIFFSTLIDRCSDLRPADRRATWHQNLSVRALRTLPLYLRAR